MAQLLRGRGATEAILRQRLAGSNRGFESAQNTGGTELRVPAPQASGGGMDGRVSVLIIDDDPTHLRIYGWILDAAGYQAVPALVTADAIAFPDDSVDVVVMDYRLTGRITAVEAAAAAQQRFPGAPIIVLSDVYDLPSDIAPYVQAFVRKGEPAKLIATLAKFPRRSPVLPDSAA